MVFCLWLSHRSVDNIDISVVAQQFAIYVESVIVFCHRNVGILHVQRFYNLVSILIFLVSKHVNYRVWIINIFTFEGSNWRCVVVAVKAYLNAVALILAASTQHPRAVVKVLVVWTVVHESYINLFVLHLHRLLVVVNGESVAVNIGCCGCNMHIVAAANRLCKRSIHNLMRFPFFVIPSVRVIIVVVFHIGKCIGLAEFYIAFALRHIDREGERWSKAVRRQTIPYCISLRIVNAINVCYSHIFRLCLSHLCNIVLPNKASWFWSGFGKLAEVNQGTFVMF